MTDLWYPKADNQTQNFTANFTGELMQPNVFLLHSTEGGDWPAYNLAGTPGDSAPNITYKRTNPAGHRFRGHYPINRSSRALRNEDGGVQTNTLNVVQMEMVGTCDRAMRGKLHDAQGNVAPYVPELDDEGMDEVAEFYAWLADHTDIPLQTLPPARWSKAYRDEKGSTAGGSYGADNGIRMSGPEWERFYGLCAHEHAPENVHGDVGDFPAADLVARAKRYAGGVQDPPDDPPTWAKLRATRLDLLGVRADISAQKAGHPNMKRFDEIQMHVQAALNGMNDVIGI